LDQVLATEAGASRPWSRYLAAHRLDLALGDWRLGCTETALIAANGSPPLWAFNPLLPWLLAQQEDREDALERTNVNWALDLVWNAAVRWVFYGQVLVDDVMIDPSDRDTHPDQLGWLAGFVNDLGRGPRNGIWRWGVEWTRLSNWTYVNRRPELRYAAWGRPLGHPAGPASEAVSGFLALTTPTAWRDVMVWGRWHRRGRVHVQTDESPVDQANLPFPAPPVARWIQFGCALRLAITGRSELDLRLGWTGRDGTAADAAIDPLDPPVGATEGAWAGLAWTLQLGPVTPGS
jgi:hypothetical protein